MKITLHHMSPESAWKTILSNHSNYHNNLKHFKGYTYITPEAIKTDLPGAVKKMMADYVALKQKQSTER